MPETTAISITTADGRTLRYGPDEPSADGVPYGLTYTSTIPGGHDTCTFNLRTRITDELPFGLLDDVRVYGPGNKTLWEGYVARLPRQSGDDFLANVQCAGHSGRLKWDTGFRDIYVDRDLSRWGPASVQRRINFSGSFRVFDAAVQPDVTTGDPSLACEITGGAWAATAKPTAEGWYNANGIPIGVLVWEYKKNGQIGLPDANWAFDAALVSDDLGSAVDSANITEAATGFGFTAATTPKPFAAALLTYNAGPAGVDTVYGLYWTTLAVYGAASATFQGLGPSGLDLAAHEILRDVIARAAPGLSDGGIEDNLSFFVPQLVFLEPITAEDAILEVNKYYLWEWGVYDAKTFFWRPPDPDRLTWEARLDQGVHLNLEGDEADNAVNGVIVTYNLPDGTSKTAGPVGSGLQAENAALGDMSATNPVNSHGIAKKYAKLDVSFVTTDAGAVAIGAAYLAQLSLPARKGSITLRGQIDHPTKGKRPVSEVRAGDWIRLSDHPADLPRRIVQAIHTPDSRECQVDVGNDVEKVDAILQRLGVQTSLVTG